MNATELAFQFSKVLRRWLTPNDFDVINRDNAAETSICHTHDYCDPNQAMIDALESFGVELNLQDEKQASLINEAWEIAKANGFDCLAIQSTNNMDQHPPAMVWEFA